MIAAFGRAMFRSSREQPLARLWWGELPSDPGGSTKGEDERGRHLPAPGPGPDIWDWQMRGACRGMDSGLFFHPENERGPARANRETRAKQICSSCPVLARCRAHTLAAHEPYGVWGGMSESERGEFVRAQNRTLRILTRPVARPALI